MKRMLTPALKLLWQQRIALITALLLLLVGELTLRTLAPEYTNRVYDAYYTGGHPINTSADDTRGRPLDESARNANVRILALGDSVSFGTGVAESDTWPRQLEARLENRAVDAAVLNTSRPGLDLDQARLLLEDRFTEYRPTHVAVVVSGNMVSLAWIRQHDEPRLPDVQPQRTAPDASLKSRLRRAYHQFALPGFLTINIERFTYAIGLRVHNVDPQAPFGSLLAYGYRQNDLDPGTPAEAWSLLAAQIDRLNRSCNRIGAKLLLAYAPSEFALNENWINNLKSVPRARLTLDPEEQLSLSAARIDPSVTFIPLHQALADAAHKDGLYILNDYTHFNPRGHSVIAERFSEHFGASTQPLTADASHRRSQPAPAGQPARAQSSDRSDSPGSTGPAGRR
ncbi:SGNH/GDSL hydrolase family protein [Mucisphaera calidilacus]|uniref:GDSL-like Lipase/Acylhydrolase n=1 Tax=Mucisphaera calidilacus TaxID=2527982 RepID=A0A518BY31_9BACT|nr:SGNH/GDSL hydrolase family protein [Mucisphaera calidilacus]QDU71885.1 GDSL-like Lipase/Acylhydrolase [Mucisphaera calidilacus]